MEDDKDVLCLKSHCDQLMEHFDAVQIFASRYTDEGTIAIKQGDGNWFARRGQVEDWLMKENEATRVEIRRSVDDSDD